MERVRMIASQVMSYLTGVVAFLEDMNVVGALATLAGASLTVVMAYKNYQEAIRVRIENEHLQKKYEREDSDSTKG